MKKLVIAVALIVASAAPVMAEGFPNPYSTAANPTSNRTLKGDTPMKKLIIAVALVVASAAPVMAEGFPNVYMTR